MPNSFTDQEELLMSLINELVEEIRYDNAFIFNLLKEVTVSKNAILDIDDVKLELTAIDEDQYKLQINPVVSADIPDFKTKGDYLREIVNGIITLDHAISSNKILIKGTLEDLMGIYRLAIGLLIEGPVSPHLRDIWNRFNSLWQQNSTIEFVADLNGQQVYDYFPMLSVTSDVNNVEIKF